MSNYRTHQPQHLLNLMERTAGLAANKRLIVMTYALLPADRSGTVEKMGREIAEFLNLTEAVFSRARRQLIEEGWLEQSSELGNIKYYRLTPKATGEQVVVPLRRTAT